MLQTLLVVVMVGACAGHAIWRLLLPAAAQSRIAHWLMRLPLPAALRRSLHEQAACPARRGCAGCDHAPSGLKPGTEQTVHWVARKSN
jgi:hypothetical protein